MEKKKKWTKESNIFCGCILFNVVLFLVLIYFGNPVFATNDDYRMRLIISGAYTGTPSGQAVFIGRILGEILAFLYRCTNEVEWYGIFTMLSMFFPTCIIEYLLLKRTKVWKDAVVKIFAIILYSGIFIAKHILMPQFTITASFWVACSMAALLECLFLLKNGDSRSLILKWSAVFGFAGLMGCMVRKKIYLMFLPLIICYLLVFFLREKKKLKLVMTLALLSLGIWGVVAGSNYILNNSEEYKEFSEFNKARSKIYDYSGVADYYESEEFYQEIGVDEAAWKNLSNRTFDMNDEINSDTLGQIYKYTTEKNKIPVIDKILEKANDSLHILVDGTLFSQIIGIILLAVLLIFYRYKSKNIWGHFLVVTSICYTIICVFGLALMGRVMDRIAEAYLLLIIAVCFGANNYLEFDIENGRESSLVNIGRINITDMFVKYVTIIVIGVILLLSNIYWLQKNESATRSVLWRQTNKLMGIEEYLQENTDKFIFYNALDFIGSTDYVFGSNRTEMLRMDSLGNWNVHSPNYYLRNNELGFQSARAGILDSKNVYYAELNDYHACINDTIEKENKKLELVDSIEIQDGVINIYQCILDYNGGDI